MVYVVMVSDSLWEVLMVLLVALDIVKEKSVYSEHEAGFQAGMGEIVIADIAVDSTPENADALIELSLV